jgi:hypothetical protein
VLSTPPPCGAGRLLAAGALSLAAAACIGPETPALRGGSDGGGVVVGLDGGAGGTGGGGDADLCPARPAPISLPFEVAAAGFVPSGFMGDGQFDAQALSVMFDPGANAGACKTPRAPGVPGEATCYRLAYSPTGRLGWGGIYWQFPKNNWGVCPGRLVAPGATRVTFYAAGATGTEKVKFIVGGITPMDATQAPYVDTFARNLPEVTLTTAWKAYTIDITATTYNGGVLGALAWTANAPPGGATVTFWIDDVIWQ